MSAALLAKLIEAGTPTELVAEVAMELARAQAVEELVEKRRAKDRERKRAPRNSVESTEVAEITEFQEKGSVEVSPPAPPLPNHSQRAPLKSPRKQVEIPEWMPASYAEFRAMRKTMRNVPFGEGAERRVIAKIERLRSEGHDPEKLLSKAIERGHRTVFEDETTKSHQWQRAEVSPNTLRERAEFFDRIGKRDDAAECRRKASQLEQGIAA